MSRSVTTRLSIRNVTVNKSFKHLSYYDSLQKDLTVVKINRRKKIITEVLVVPIKFFPN